MNFRHLISLGCIALGLYFSDMDCLLAQSNKTLKTGVDANYSLDMVAGGATWRWQNGDSNLLEGIARSGVTEFRVRVWTKDDGPHGKKYASELIQQARQAGLNPYAVIFLSDDWADLMKQPVPAAWKDLNFEDRVKAVREYSFETVQYLRKEGLENHLYEIGNEIDYGICGEYPGKSTKKNPESLSRRCWPQAAKLILASQAGVRQADPDAKFMLHISHWWDTDFCVRFFQFMQDEGIQIDFAGLSYFPTSNIGGSLEFEEFGATASAISQAIHRPIIVPETAYPSTRDFKGQFSRWKYEVMGYPITPDGQRRWLQEFLAYCHHHPSIDAVYYWSPEWHGEGMWKGFALFDPSGKAKPAWEAFDPKAWQSLELKQTRYFEVHQDQLYPVPIEEARSLAMERVNQLREQTGRHKKSYRSVKPDTIGCGCISSRLERLTAAEFEAAHS